MVCSWGLDIGRLDIRDLSFNSVGRIASCASCFPDFNFDRKSGFMGTAIVLDIYSNAKLIADGITLVESVLKYVIKPLEEFVPSKRFWASFMVFVGENFRAWYAVFCKLDVINGGGG
jgi:hypothetical protein